MTYSLLECGDGAVELGELLQAKGLDAGDILNLLRFRLQQDVFSKSVYTPHTYAIVRRTHTLLRFPTR
jgi:hypothetical protein